MPPLSLPDIPFRFPRRQRPARSVIGLCLEQALSVRSTTAGLFAHTVCAWRTAMRNAELSLFLFDGASAAGMLHMRPNWTIAGVITVRWLSSTRASRPRSDDGPSRLGENLDSAHTNVNNLAGFLRHRDPTVTRPAPSRRNSCTGQAACTNSSADRARVAARHEIVDNIADATLASGEPRQGRNR
jgi:hypothetical protein